MAGYLIGGKKVSLGAGDLLGVGGEARVYAWGDLAVKVFHAPDATLPKAEKAAAERRLARKHEKVRAFPTGLPDEVVGPIDVVTDARTRAPVGFTMRRVDGAEDIRRLSQRKWREGVVDNETVTALFGRLHRVLGALHARAVVVGDLNDANVLFAGDRPFLIDADSMQFGGHACEVGHERFLDPALFGVDLSAPGAFSERTDWYAFCVLLFGSLLYVHPYGGVHARLPTLLRRAEASHSVLRDDVRYPKAGVPFAVLPDELLHWFSETFDRGRRDPFPPKLLAIDWTRCGCGLVHARRRCPDCVTAGRVVEATRHHGRCRARRVLSTTGRIVAAVAQGGTLRWLCLQDGVLRREDGSAVMRQDLAPGVRAVIAGRATWVGLGERLVRIESEQVTERTACARFGNEPAFDATPGGCWRALGGWLIDGEGRRVGQVLEAQTWVRAGERFGLVFYRTGRLLVASVFRAGRPGLKRVELPAALDGRLLEATASFAGDRALLQLSVEKAGKVTSHMWVIDEDARVLATLSGRPDAHRCLGSVHGKAIVGDRILCPTEDGLLLLEVDRAAGVIRERDLFVDTEPFVGSGTELLPGPGGSVWAVTTHEITQLTLE